MHVERTPLPGAATVVVFKVQRRVLVDSRLSRDEAALAIAGVLPDVHPDIVDHWLDTAFDRRRLPFTVRQTAAMFGTAMLVFALTVPPQLANQFGARPRRRPIAVGYLLPGLPDRERPALT